MNVRFSSGEIKVVDEFCPYGDLKSFLKKNRQSTVEYEPISIQEANAFGVYGNRAPAVAQNEGRFVL